MSDFDAPGGLELDENELVIENRRPAGGLRSILAGVIYCVASFCLFLSCLEIGGLVAGGDAGDSPLGVIVGFINFGTALMCLAAAGVLFFGGDMVRGARLRPASLQDMWSAEGRKRIFLADWIASVVAYLILLPLSLLALAGLFS